MSAQPHRSDVEALLSRALAPVEPPEHLSVRLEDTLTTITALAADELEAWELRSLHDPRTWVRPAVAVGDRHRRRRRPRRPAGAPARAAAGAPADADPVEFAAGAVRTIADEVERRLRG